MSSYELERQENIKRNRALINALGLTVDKPVASAKPPPSKKRKLHETTSKPLPTRSSARIASVPKLAYASRPPSPTQGSMSRSRKKPLRVTPKTQLIKTEYSPAPTDIDSIRAGWTSWSPSSPAPIRDEDGTFHFASYPTFQPNKAPTEILREGAFGGSYFRPLYSKKLRVTIEDDWRELPDSWTEGLDVERYLTSQEYDPEVNKYGVSCGQSIEEWEAAGWIAHDFDVRGWFQWYCRFFLGRRCADDERQVRRWARCVGDKGRWRRMLLKKYIAAGVRSVVDDGDDEEEDGKELSPVIHQTCHHWAWEVRQSVLDDAWGQ